MSPNRSDSCSKLLPRRHPSADPSLVWHSFTNLQLVSENSSTRANIKKWVANLATVSVGADGVGVIIGIVATKAESFDAAKSGSSTSSVLVNGNHLTRTTLLDHLGRAETVGVCARVVINIPALNHFARAVVTIVEFEDSSVGGSSCKGDNREKLHDEEKCRDDIL